MEPNTSFDMLGKSELIVTVRFKYSTIFFLRIFGFMVIFVNRSGQGQAVQKHNFSWALWDTKVHNSGFCTEMRKIQIFNALRHEQEKVLQST